MCHIPPVMVSKMCQFWHILVTRISAPLSSRCTTFLCPHTGVEGVHRAPEPVQEAPGAAGKKVCWTSQVVKSWSGTDPPPLCAVKTGSNGSQGTTKEDSCQPKEETSLCLLSV